MSKTISAVLIHPDNACSQSKAFAISAHIARIILGVIFFVLGLNGFLHFIPMPPPTGEAGEFFYGLIQAHYFLPLMAFIQIICGAFLLSGTAIPFALLLLFPISLNIFFFHLALDPAGLGPAALVMAANILLAVCYWPVYKPIFNIENAWKRKNHTQRS